MARKNIKPIQAEENVTQREDKEKVRVRRQETGKLFYDLCKTTFAVTVLGNFVSILGFGNSEWSSALLVIFAGLLLSGLFFSIGYHIFNS